MTQAKNYYHQQINSAASQHGRRMQPIHLLWIVLGLRSIFFLVELATGLLVHSLSLIAISGHMLVDVLSIVIALGAARLTQYSSQNNIAAPQQIEAWAALVNSTILIEVAALLLWGIMRQTQPPELSAGLPMLVMAALGFVVSGISASLLYQESHHNLNVRGVFLHAIADAASSVSLILAALALLYFKWLWADVVASLLVAALIFLNALSLLKDSLQMLKPEML